MFRYTCKLRWIYDPPPSHTHTNIHTYNSKNAYSISLASRQMSVCWVCLKLPLMISLQVERMIIKKGFLIAIMSSCLLLRQVQSCVQHTSLVFYNTVYLLALSQTQQSSVQDLIWKIKETDVSVIIGQTYNITWV